MPHKDLHEKLLRYYEFQLGRLPNRDTFKEALLQTLTFEELQVFFLLPFFGMLNEPRLRKKAGRINCTPDEIIERAHQLVPQGIIDSYIDEKKGRLFGRAPFIALLEFQVRLQEASPLRQVSAEVMQAFVEGAVDVIPTRTPYYRVLPVEASITGQGNGKRIPVGARIPDKRGVLPIDVISEMIRNEPLIVVADCYCRATQNLLGTPCNHPLETCFYFNELALVKLEAGGYARQVSYEEAMQILWECERAGLVHNVDNCEGHITTLCNCCSCACAVMRSIERGQSNIGAPSRYISRLDPAICLQCGECISVCPVSAISIHGSGLEINQQGCIGCGHCVSSCPEGALFMELRSRPPKIVRDNSTLMNRINREAILGLLRKKILGR